MTLIRDFAQNIKSDGDLVISGNMGLAETPSDFGSGYSLRIGNATKGGSLVLRSHDLGNSGLLQFVHKDGLSAMQLGSSTDTAPSPDKIYGYIYNYNNDFRIQGDNGTHLIIDGNGTATFADSIFANDIFLSAVDPISFTSQGNTGTYDRTVIYGPQNNTSGNTANGILIERGRLTDAFDAEVRHFVIGSRGGQSQVTIDGVGNTTFAGTISSGAITSSGAISARDDYNTSTQGGAQLTLYDNTTDALNMKFGVDTAIGSNGGGSIQVTETSVSNDRDLKLNPHGGKVSVGVAVGTTLTDTFTVEGNSYTSGDATFGGSINVETDIRLDVPYRSSKRISNIIAADTQAKRYHIGRLYYTSAHWSVYWTTIRIKCRQTNYTNGELEYVIRNGYTGGNGVPHNIYLVSNIGYTQDFNLFLDNPVDAGWDHTSSGDVYYQDVYADVDYYQNWTLDITSSTSYIYNTNASGFGDNYRTVFYDSPTSSNIASFTQGHGIDHPSYHNTISFGDGSGINFGLMTGGGAFSAGTGTSSTLDDYEEGTWTPTLQGFTGSYAVRDAAYTKIGNTVFAEFHIDVNVPGGSGDLVITGLPFTKENISNHYGGVTSLHCNGWSTTTKPDGGIIPFNTTLINFYTSLGQTSATKPNLTDLGSGNFLGVAVYRA